MRALKTGAERANVEPVAYASVETPLGPMVVKAVTSGVVSVGWLDEEGPLQPDAGAPTEAQAWADVCAAQLSEYFAGNRQTFDVPVLPSGTDFQKSVWQALSQIPYGETRSYAEIAEAIGNRRAVRAVGQANRRNPIAVVIPCHRVIGASGQLVGYSGTRVDLKAELLDLERRSRG